MLRGGAYLLKRVRHYTSKNLKDSTRASSGGRMSKALRETAVAKWRSILSTGLDANPKP